MYNPVDWYPWGEEALQRARQEDKPIFLSIGYSTCHWCHVMAHECFENPRIAALMNEHFINIKVDREERPDLDEIYMNAVQLLTGRGGWPMSVFLTPDLKPFYAGTYFPPEDRPGLPGFPRLLQALAKSYRDNRQVVEKLTGEVTERLKLVATLPGETREAQVEALLEAAARLMQEFDPDYGGFGGAPKFPRPLELGFLLTVARLYGDDAARQVVSVSLTHMATGGLYDQVGGGFHRYCVDREWVVPHFEKMLYDNALLAPLYLADYQLSGNPLSRRIARETLDWVLRDCLAPQGAFYAAWDADSEGVEGKFYVFSWEEFRQAVGEELLELAATAFGVTRGGNFEGKNVLTRLVSEAELAEGFGLTEKEVNRRLEEARARLQAAREARVKPHRDEKIITAWNGLMISALCAGAQVLGDPAYAAQARRAAEFILMEMTPQGRLQRIFADGRLSVPGFLDDHAALLTALLDLYETDADPGWLHQAVELADRMEALFLDPEDGAYFYVGADQESVLVRSKSAFDQAVPGGNSLAALGLWRLHRLTEEERFGNRSRALVRRFLGNALGNPWGFAHFLLTPLLSLAPPLDLTLVGDKEDPRTQALFQTIHAAFLPGRRLVCKDLRTAAVLEALVPGARYYEAPPEGPAVYLCHRYTCQPPLTDPGELAARLQEVFPLREGG
jgi:uncharacterized protein YyaL (SSP411 family)